MAIPEPIDATKPLVLFETDYEGIIAHSRNDARELLKSELGYAGDDMSDDDLRVVPADRPITMACEPTGKPAHPDDVKADLTTFTHPAAHWVETVGRGVLWCME